jgi:hypothetical protein
MRINLCWLVVFIYRLHSNVVIIIYDITILNCHKNRNTVIPLLRGHLLWQRKSGLIKHVTSLKKFNWYEISYGRTRKMWPFNTGDCLIEVNAWAGLTVFIYRLRSIVVIIYYDIIKLNCHKN